MMKLTISALAPSAKLRHAIEIMLCAKSGAMKKTPNIRRIANCLGVAELAEEP